MAPSQAPVPARHKNSCPNDPAPPDSIVPRDQRTAEPIAIALRLMRSTSHPVASVLKIASKAPIKIGFSCLERIYILDSLAWKKLRSNQPY